jgi:hypothetical protein
VTIAEAFRAATRRAVLELLLPSEPDIMLEREELLRQKYTAMGLTLAEEHRLAVLRSRLDRIDDAVAGPGLDEVERRLGQVRMKGGAA